MKKLVWLVSTVALISFARSGAAQQIDTPEPPPDSVPPVHTIWVDKVRQRVYGFDGSRLVFEAACSTAAHRVHWAPGDGEYEMPITPVGNYHIFEKTPDHFSKAYEVHMQYALFYDGGRAIHATSRSEYRHLGRPASGGCVRLTRSKAIELYDWARVGDPVHVVNGLPLQFASIVQSAHPQPILVLRSHRPPMLTVLKAPTQLRNSAPETIALMQTADYESMEPAF